jgi:hypothetical protein
MAIDINNREARSGRLQREDNRFVNMAGKSGLRTEDELSTFIHEGFAWCVDVDGSLLASGSLLLLGVTGDKEVHFLGINGLWSSGDIRYTLYEAPTVTANGAALSPCALNRPLADTSTMTIYSGPTVTENGNGTKVGGAFLPGTGVGVNLQSVSGGIAGGRVLKKNTKYLIEITNESAITASYGINFTWGEANYDV